MLAHLEAKGLITRTPSEFHRQVLATSLTSLGRSVFRKADTAARAVEADMSAALTTAEEGELRALLQRVTDRLRDRQNDPATAGQDDHP